MSIRHKTVGVYRGPPQHIPRLPPGSPAPRFMRAELHYIYSLILFSGAWADAESMTYSPGTECGRLEYERDGRKWVLVIRENKPG